MAISKIAPRRDAVRLLTPQEIAEHLQLSIKTIRRKIAAGELPAMRVGRFLRITEEDFRLFKMQRRIGGV